MGLDPGYRRLFVEYLRDYAQSEEKTVFLTSHIIQDMEKLVDDCIIMDYGSILVQMPVGELLGIGDYTAYNVAVGVSVRKGYGKSLQMRKGAVSELTHRIVGNAVVYDRHQPVKHRTQNGTD